MHFARPTLIRSAGFLVCLGLVQAVPARDWTEHPAVVEVDTSSDIYAVGDAHSDYERLAHVLQAAGLIETVPATPLEALWRAEGAVLVVTGDMIDKGPRALDVLRLLMTLQADASRHGGRVVVLAGNHEAEFLADASAPKGADFASELRRSGMNPAGVARCNGKIGEFLCGLPFAARVNDWYFSHAGNTQGRALARIATDIRTGFSQEGYGAAQLIGDYSILEARLNGNGKGREPWIDAKLPSMSESSLLRSYAAALGVHHIVQGHVPASVLFADGVQRNAGEMFQRFGLLFLIDTGMSEGVDDSLGAVLHINARSAIAVCPDGRKTTLWTATGGEDIGRAAACR